MHGFACVFDPCKLSPAPVLLRPEPTDAPALKATYQAGRRGGESIARQSVLIYCQHFFILTPIYRNRSLPM
ncbi:hypothetical protein MLU89_11595 [Escherichia coli]|nr:hypothetical protein [Escherichia coli]